MKDINKEVRKAFYTRLNGNLTYASVPVPISDKKLKSSDDSVTNYVILASQTSTDASTKTSFDRDATIVIDINTKTSDSVSSDIADNIADQILQLIFPTPSTNSLPAPTNWQFVELRLSNDINLALTLTVSSNLVRRILTFSLRVVQN